MDRRKFLQAAAMSSACALKPEFVRAGRVISAAGPASGKNSIPIKIDQVKGYLPHVWEECVGSDRAVVGLREQWLSDLDQVHKELGFKSVRFHGLFNDEMGVWPLGSRQPNFLYVDMVFDAMVERGVKPFVELSFMPAALASGTRTVFWYRGNATPPKEMTQWGELVGALGKHCVDRYGIQEVSTWNFEVWNEPNLGFWTGTKSDYFELYRQSVNALKGIDKRFRVGGPATAEAAWSGDMLEFCSSQQLPIDFVSTHIYPDDPQKIVFGEDVHYPLSEVVWRALKKVREEIRASKTPDIPFYITEWCAQNPALIAHIIKSTIGLADIMSYWTFDNVFEEQGVPRTFLNSAYGMLGTRGVPRPSYHTFVLLRKLGDVQLETGDGPVLATRRRDGSVAILAWNLIPLAAGRRSYRGDMLQDADIQDLNQGKTLTLTLKMHGQHKYKKASITRVDENNGSFRQAYKEIGSPAYPTVEQIAELKKKTEMNAPETIHIDAQGQISLTIPANGVALFEIA